MSTSLLIFYDKIKIKIIIMCSDPTMSLVADFEGIELYTWLERS